MIIPNLGEAGATPALVKTMAFNGARLEMIAENVANASTPGYRTKQLDERAFQRALRDALDRKEKAPNKPFDVRSGTEVQTNDRGLLEVSPSIQPAENALFHDGTNMSIEKQMADLAETNMMHELATTLLRSNVDGMRKAIRGRVS